MLGEGGEGARVKVKIPLDAAIVEAAALVYYLQSECEKIEVAGSIRRRKAEVGDIELVCIPKMYEAPKDLFGNETAPPADKLREAIRLANKAESMPSHLEEWLEHQNDGSRYMKLWDNRLDVQIDLFVVRPPAEWPIIYTIRTGPAEFSQRLVTGLRTRGMRCQDGRIIRKDGTHVPCPDEQTFFKLAGYKWKEPENR